jgi:hypothetical protein
MQRKSVLNIPEGRPWLMGQLVVKPSPRRTAAVKDTIKPKGLVLLEGYRRKIIINQ